MSAPFSRGRPRIWTEDDGPKSLPKEWGAYRFMSDDKVRYIGITSNIYNRMSDHRSSRVIYGPHIHRIEYQIAQDGTSWDDLMKWEKAKIKQHSPDLNVTEGGNGKRPIIQVAGGHIIEVNKYESYEDALVRSGFLGLLRRFVGFFL